MCRRFKGFLGLLGLMLMSFQPLVAQEWISDIKASPQRYVNREVTVVGQVMSTTSNPAGTTRGTYMIMDDSDPAGIPVRTRELPPPGLEFEVTGVVTQDPATATLLIDESGRVEIGRPAWLLPALLLAGAAVLLLGFLLFGNMRRRQPVAAGATVRPAPAPTVRPTPAPASTEAPTAAPTPPTTEGDETELIRDTSDETEIYRHLGCSLQVSGGPDAGKEFAIGKTTTFIGRAGRRSNDITLVDSTVSREQAKLLYNEETKAFTLVNESKKNPTRVDGVSIDAKELEDGFKIEMGKTTLTFTRS